MRVEITGTSRSAHMEAEVLKLQYPEKQSAINATCAPSSSQTEPRQLALVRLIEHLRHSEVVERMWLDRTGGARWAFRAADRRAHAGGTLKSGRHRFVTW